MKSWETSIASVTTEQNHVAKNTLHVVDPAEQLFSKLRVDLGRSEWYKRLRADVSVQREKSVVDVVSDARPHSRIQRSLVVNCVCFELITSFSVACASN